jgi:hypothetical protein
VDLVLFVAGATVEHFACCSDQVGLHLFFFQLHGLVFFFIASFILKYEALSCPKQNQLDLFENQWKNGILFTKTF